jgi:hypothetical protein
MAGVEETAEADVSDLDALLEPQEATPPAAAGPRNRPPRLTGVQIDPAQRITAGNDITVVAHATDPDGDLVEIVYTWWVNDDEVDAEGPVFSTQSLRRGDEVRVRVVASDGGSDSQPMEGPPIRVENGVPEIVSRPAAAGPDGAFRYQVLAEDPEGDTNLRYRLAQAPNGMTVTAIGGLVEWHPRSEQGGVHPVEIVVEDSAGGQATQRFELTMTPPAAPAP